MQDVRRGVGRYEIMSELGRGGMATVYLARQIDLERLVALKELAALRLPDASFAQRFLREARVAGSLSHPNIVTVHDFLQQDGTPYIAMEYVEHGSLRHTSARCRWRRSAPCSRACWRDSPTPSARASSIATSSPRTS